MAFPRWPLIWIGSWLVVSLLILRQPLSRMSSGPPRKGQFVAAIAVYGDVSEASIGLDHWTDFSPVVVDLVSGNQRDIDRVVESLNDQNWQELKLGLGQIPDSPEPGIYRVWQPDHQSNPVDERQRQGAYRNVDCNQRSACFRRCSGRSNSE